MRKCTESQYCKNTRLKAVCYIVDTFSKHDDKSCSGQTIKEFETVDAAMSACSENNQCGCLSEDSCDGRNVTITKGLVMESSSAGSCAHKLSLSKSHYLVVEQYIKENRI